VEAQIQTLLDSVADLQEKASVNACFGEPVAAEGRTVIPVAEVAYAFGLGAGYGLGADEEVEGKAPEEAGGGGGGVKARPFAVIEVTSEGTYVEPIIDEQKVTLAGVLLVGWSVFWLTRALVKIFKP